MAFKLMAFGFLIALCSCQSTRYFIVRHAEKAVIAKDSAGMMASNPPLSEPGKVRAFVLRDELKDDKIENIYSTNTIRTITTAQPISEWTGKQVILYSPSKDSTDAFITRLRSLKGNTLVVGHSNTVDDIVNKLMGKTEFGDLPDSEYDNLFIVTRKGKKWIFERKKYGYPSAP